jgi:methyl-accepting chemotaxis protein
MATPKIEKMIGEMTEAIQHLADAITPTNATGAVDASGGFVSSHTEALMGLTSSMQSIANSISDLADAIRESRS